MAQNSRKRRKRNKRKGSSDANTSPVPAENGEHVESVDTSDMPDDQSTTDTGGRCVELGAGERGDLAVAGCSGPAADGSHPPVAPSGTDVRHHHEEECEGEKVAEASEIVLKTLLQNIAQDLVGPYNMTAIQDAEEKHFSRKKSSAPAASKVEDELDLFASDEDEAPKPKPAMVKPSKKEKAPKTQSKARAEKVWENKAECDEAELKFQERLAQGGYRNPANGERTFIMLKPDAVQRGLVGTIMDRFEARGFKLLAAKFLLAEESLLRKHYADLSKKGFFPELIRYMGSGPVVPMVWQGLNAVKQGRAMLGATNPKDSAPGTIRGDFCVDVGRNIIHGSDSVESAEKEIKLWFSESEISMWRPAETEWVYEEEEVVKGVTAGSAPKVDGLVSQVGDEDMALASKLSALEIENKQLKKVTEDLKGLILRLESRVTSLEGGKGAAPAAKAPAAAEDDDDVDLFGSDDEEEDAEKARITAERLKAYSEKKSKKPALIAKTSVLFDVKPWDDETDMKAMLESVKSIEMDGLVWGASKLVPVGYGINKLQVMCTVEDEKVSIEELGEKIEAFEDFVQSVDVAAMNKI